MENLNVQIGEILAEGQKRDRARAKAVGKNRAKAGAVGKAYADRMNDIRKDALGLLDNAMHNGRTRRAGE